MRILFRRRPGQAAQALLYVSDDLHELNIGNIVNVNGYLFHVQDATDVQHIQAPSFKVCRVCGAEKPITAFYKQPTSPDGYCTDCKDCRKAYYNEYMNRKRRIRQHERSQNTI